MDGRSTLRITLHANLLTQVLPSIPVYDDDDDDRVAELQPFIVLANKHYLRNLTTDGSYYGLLAQGFDNVVHLDFDYQQQMLYFADTMTQRVYRMKWTDSDPSKPPSLETILRHNIYGIEGLGVDWIGRCLLYLYIFVHNQPRKLYNLNRQERTLSVCELNGTSCKVLLRDRFTQPRSMAIYPQKGYLFFAEWSLSPYIARIGLDGELIGGGSVDH